MLWVKYALKEYMAAQERIGWASEGAGYGNEVSSIGQWIIETVLKAFKKSFEVLNL